MKHPLLGPTFPLGGAFLLSYPYLVVFPIVDVFLKKRSKAVLLISMVVALPLLGPYIYFEKYIFKTYFGRTEDSSRALDHNRLPQVPPEVLWRRALAAIIDYGVFFMILFAHIRTYGTKIDDNTWVVTGLGNTLFYFVVWFAYFPAAEGIWGRTLGKACLGLRVVADKGGRVSFGAAIKRHLLDFIDLIYFGTVAIAVTSRGTPRRLGDRWAHTLVVLKGAKLTQPTEPAGSTQE